MPKTTFLQRLEFLARELEMPAEEVIKLAVEAGVNSMYRQCMGEKYIAGQLSRDKALQLLGPQEVARLECIAELRCHLAEDEIDLICGHA